MELEKVNIEGLIEFLNDCVFTSILLKTYERLPISYTKDYLGYFLLNTSTIYIYDFVQSKFLGEMKLSSNNKKYLKSLRVNTLKFIGDPGSKHISKKIKEMGINFEDEINDCVITYSENQLYDINFRCWYPYNNIEFKKFSYDLINNCDLLLKEILVFNQVNIYDSIINDLNELINKYAKQIDSKNIKMYSYSSNVMFKNSNISNGEKILIFQYYGFIKSILYFESIFNKKVLTIEFNGLLFNSDYYFIKLKSLFIVSFFDALSKTSFLYSKIKEYIDNNIPDDFWSKNREIRRNIHYKDYVKKSDDEYKYVKKYQELYLSKVIELMDEQMNVVINYGVKINTFISKIVGRFIKRANN